MRAPRFWSKPRPTLLARLLQPTGWAYGRATAQRMRGQGERAGAPTICVGNFTVGGAGKTPAALALARMLIGDGRRVAFLSRGYGGVERAEPLLVDPESHTAKLVGDAVHATTPQLASGACCAIEDGLLLADYLQGPGTLDAALRAFTDRRFDRCRDVVDSSRRIGQLELARAPSDELAGVYAEAMMRLAARA